MIMVGRGGGGGSSGGGGWLDSIRTKFGGGSGGFVLHKRRRFAIKRGLDLDLDLTNGRREEEREWGIRGRRKEEDFREEITLKGRF